MRNKIKLIKLEDGFIGTMDEIADRINMSTEYVTRAILDGEPLREKKYEVLGFFQKVPTYRALCEGEVVIEGTAEEVGKKIGYKPTTIIAAAKGRILKGQYTIRTSKEKLVKLDD